MVKISWDETQTTDTDITHIEWNAMVTYIKTIIEESNYMGIQGAEPTNQTGTGIIVSDINAGETIAISKLVYLKSDGEWWKTDADAEATTKGMLGLTLEAGTNGNAMKVLVHGTYRDDATFSFTAGDELYVSTTTGDATSTAPSGTADIVRIIGYAITDDFIYFNPSSTYVEIT